MYFSTTTFITLLTIFLNTLSVSAVSAKCVNKDDKSAVYFSDCASGMHVAACCPPSQPQLMQDKSREIKLYCYDASPNGGLARIRPITPQSCDKG
jgi:hypothetical protein